MKKIIILLLCLSLTGIINAQNDKSSRKAEKEARREAAAAEEKAAATEAAKALSMHDFAIEADRVEFRSGMPEFVNPSTNFVSLQGNIATIQLSSNSTRQGLNGMGGLTLEGKATAITSSVDERGNTLFSMLVNGRGISARVNITLIKNSNKCEAEISGNFSGSNITFSGKLYPAGKSSVFKGRTL